ncbi:protocatechuate 3,4-dioxygenase subunit alpha [Rhodobacteraceae bacterium NNCM2]|nr:protocatechuate 3,4-dioxygenase subunit alpha [Coraliihabitans acroporae]
MTKLRESPSQTAGPYVHIGCMPNAAGIGGVFPADLGAEMVNDQTLGERMTLILRVFDGEGAPMTDAVVEIWQADANGIYPGGEQGDPNFTGWGRQPADQEGAFTFHTIRPGTVPFADGRMQAPHVSLWIVARGINLGLNTRVYLPEDAAEHAADPVLSLVDPARRETLIARKGNSGYAIDIHLQGAHETVFFDI